MDPTLAPGYVSPKNAKSKAKKEHHWAEIKKSRTVTNDSDQDIADGELSSTSTASTPRIQSVVPHSAATSGTGKMSSRHLHTRISSSKPARVAVSDNEAIGGPADLEEVPVGVKRQAIRLEDYAFPEHRLRTVMEGIFLSIAKVTNIR
jgi:hypothetical protein